MRKIFLTLFICLPLFTFAQEKPNVPKELAQAVANKERFDSRGIDGTPYFQKDYHQIVVKINGKNFSLKGRYNIFYDYIALKIKGGAAVLDPLKMDGFTIKGKNDLVFEKGYISKKYDIDEDNFLHVRVKSGKVQLLSRYIVTTEVADRDTGYASENEYTGRKSFQKRITHYIYTENQLESVKLRKSAILGKFPDKKDELNTYIKKNKINVRIPEGLEKVVIKYNELVK